MGTDRRTEDTSFNTIWFLFGLLIGWTVLLAVGTCLFADSIDLRKPLVVMGTMGGFLGVWWTALKSLQQRQTNR